MDALVPGLKKYILDKGRGARRAVSQGTDATFRNLTATAPPVGSFAVAFFTRRLADSGDYSTLAMIGANELYLETGAFDDQLSIYNGTDFAASGVTLTAGGVWRHVCITCSGTGAGLFRLFVDSVQVAAISINTGSAGTLTIGSTGADLKYQGIYSHLTVANRAWTIDDVRLHMKEPWSKALRSGLARYLPYNDRKRPGRAAYGGSMTEQTLLGYVDQQGPPQYVLKPKPISRRLIVGKAAASAGDTASLAIGQPSEEPGASSGIILPASVIGLTAEAAFAGSASVDPSLAVGQVFEGGVPGFFGELGLRDISAWLGADLSLADGAEMPGADGGVVAPTLAPGDSVEQPFPVAAESLVTAQLAVGVSEEDPRAAGVAASSDLAVGASAEAPGMGAAAALPSPSAAVTADEARATAVAAAPAPVVGHGVETPGDDAALVLSSQVIGTSSELPGAHSAVADLITAVLVIGQNDENGVVGIFGEDGLRDIAVLVGADNALADSAEAPWSGGVAVTASVSAGVSSEFPGAASVESLATTTATIGSSAEAPGAHAASVAASIAVAYDDGAPGATGAAHVPSLAVGDSTESAGVAGILAAPTSADSVSVEAPGHAVAALAAALAAGLSDELPGATAVVLDDTSIVYAGATGISDEALMGATFALGYGEWSVASRGPTYTGGGGRTRTGQISGSRTKTPGGS